MSYAAEPSSHRQAILKASIVGAAHMTDAPSDNGHHDPFEGLDALQPPHDPELLCRILEH